MGSSSGGGGYQGYGPCTAGSDKLTSTDDDQDKFSSGDAPQVTVTSTAPAGAVTTVGITATDSDSGTARAHDDITDNETLPTKTTGETDKFKFDDSASEQDTATDGATLNISENGLLKANDNADLQETLTLGDVTKTKLGVDDPGTENDTPAGDSESDKLVENSDVKDNLRLTDKLHSVETTTAADGTVTTDTADSGFVETSQDDQTDTLTDKHADGVGVSDGSTDDETFDDQETSGDQIKGSDTLGVSTSGPVNISASFGQPAETGVQYTSNVVGDEYTASDGDTNDDNGEDISHNVTDPQGNVTLQGGGSEHDTDTDTSFGWDKGKEFAMSNFNQTLTDPATGVKTIIGTDDLVLDKFKDNGNDHATDKHTDSGDDVTGGDLLQTEDYMLNYDEADVSVVGSPSPGVTENINDDITLSGGGNDDFQETDAVQDSNLPPVVGYVSNVPGTGGSSGGSSSGETDDETDQVVEDTTSQETIGINDNSTTTSIDPTTGLTTTDTLLNGGKIQVGDEVNDQNTDNYTYGLSTDPTGAGEDDITDHEDDQESVNGNVSSTDTTNVRGTLPDGTTINSTDTRGEVSTISLYADDNKQTTGTDLSNSGGQPTSESSQTVDNSDDSVAAQDKNTESIQSTISTIDPVTGLKLAESVNEQSGDTAIDTDNSNGTNVGSYSTGQITQGIVPTGTSTSTESGFDDETQSDFGFTHLKLTVKAQGTDSQGERVNLTETTTLDDSGTDSGSDDDTVTTDGTDTEVAQDQVSAGAQLTDFVSGTVASTAPTTGVTTTTTYDDLNVAEGSDNANDADTTATPGSNGTGSGSSSDTSTFTDYWNIHDTTTQTNADGSSAGPSSTNDVAGNDTQSDVNGATTDLGANSPSPSSGNAPSVTAVTTAGTTTTQATTAGGDAVVITGSGFTPDSQAIFDGTQAQSTIVLSGTTIVAVTPAHNAGNASVTVANANGVSGAGPQAQIEYENGGNGGSSGSGATTAGAPGQSNNGSGSSASGSTTGGGSGGGGGGFFSWLFGKEKGAQTKMAETLIEDGLKPAYDPGAKKLDTIITEVETNRAAAANVLGNPNFFNFQDVADAAESYVKNALGTIFIGAWSGAETNALGVAGSIVYGLAGLDTYKDLADVSHDVANWKWSWKHVRGTALDLVAILPLIGAVKILKNADELATVTKAVTNTGEAVADTAKQVGKAGDALQDVKQGVKGLIEGFDFGKHLRSLIGDPPKGMIDPHAHHVLFKKGLGPAQQALVDEGQALLRKVGIDPIYGKENLVWAPWRVSQQHDIESLTKVVDRLRELDKLGADYDDFVAALKEFGEIAARRGN